MEVEGLPPGVGQTGEFDHPAAKQGLVTGELIDHPCALPVREALHPGLPAPAGRVVEDDDRWLACQDSGNNRFWFDTRPNLRREMEERKRRFQDKEDVSPAIRDRVQRGFSSRLR